MTSTYQIKSELQELKAALSPESILVPSLWSCIWPGVMFTAWFLLCFSIQYVISPARDDIDLSIASSLFFGFLITIGGSNVRSLLLAIPYEFRERSSIYRLLAKKATCYMYTALIVSLLSAILCGVFNMSWGVILFFLSMVFGLLMIIDFSRYQLSMLSNIVSAFILNH